MKIAVTGATGQLGRLVIAELKSKVGSQDLVALVRNPEKATDLGTEVREFDYSKPDSLAAGLEGIDRLLLISGSEIGKRFEQHSNVIAAAKKAGVRWIVYTSLLHADNSTISLAGEHVATEQALRESGIPYTLLRNGWYTENHVNSIPGALGAGAYVGSAGEGKISAATRQDFAEAAAVVILDEKHIGKTYELAGDEAYTLSEFAAEINKHSGKNIPYSDLPETEYANILKSVGLPDGLAAAIASWDTSITKGDLYDDSKQLSALIGRPTTPMEVTVQEALS
jgi:NAD(P)H dehydrogenase (quinone)